MKSTQNRQHGYVLLLTLVMVTLVAAGTMGLTRTSLAAATEAKRAELDLQRRWAVVSCKRVLLEHAPQMFEQKWESLIGPGESDAESSKYTPLEREQVRVLAWQIVLGDLNINLRLSDEQAKLNVNAMLADHDPNQASMLIDTLTSTSTGIPLDVDLRPMDDSDESLEQVPTLERVFRNFDPSLMFDDISTDKMTLPVDAVTCWGDQRLRLSLASDEVLRLLLEPHLDATRLEHLIQIRAERPDITVDRAIRALSLSPSQSRPVRNLLADQSNCYALWITVSSEQRSWYSLDVHQMAGNPGTRNLTYLW